MPPSVHARLFSVLPLLLIGVDEWFDDRLQKAHYLREMLDAGDWGN